MNGEHPHQNLSRNNSQHSSTLSPIAPRKRTFTDRSTSGEYDEDDELLESYKNDDAQSLIIPAEKRRRFLDTSLPGGKELFRQTVQDIWHVVNRQLFRHQYGTLPEGHIRIMIIEPGKYNDPLRATLMSKKLDANLHYDALSYVWGEDLPLHPIKIIDKTRRGDGMHHQGLHPRKRLKNILIDRICAVDGLTFYIRSNLDAAIRRIRSEKIRIPIW